MLASSRAVPLSTGHSIRTPLLVPSISSAGFKRVHLDSGGTEPEPAAWLRMVHTFMSESLLISAYDAAHGNLPFPEDLAENFVNGLYSGPKTLFVDSGLYEHRYGPPPFYGARLDWTESDYERFVTGLPTSPRTVLVNFDGYDAEGQAEFDAQIDTAQRFFTAHPEFVSDILVKPEQRDRVLQVEVLNPRTLASLRGFDIVGFAEKDLGDSVLDKLCSLVTLRRRLTEAGVDAPIHLFGSLDPVMSPLYFAAGAEIFDGLSWLRYGYHWEAAVYRDDVPVLEASQNLAEPEQARTGSILVGNLRTLGVLAENMRQFATTGEWGLFGSRVGDRLQAAHVALTTRIGE
jgi:hypothetical protein